MPVTIRLNDIQIATPCRANWNKMEWQNDDGRVRHCSICQKNVYNVSLMSRAEAEALLARYEGELYFQLARRTDSTLVTGECPVGNLENPRTRSILAIIAVLFFLAIPTARQHAPFAE